MTLSFSLWRGSKQDLAGKVICGSASLDHRRLSELPTAAPGGSHWDYFCIAAWCSRVRVLRANFKQAVGSKRKASRGQATSTHDEQHNRLRSSRQALGHRGQRWARARCRFMPYSAEGKMLRACALLCPILPQSSSTQIPLNRTTLCTQSSQVHCRLVNRDVANLW